MDTELFLTLSITILGWYIIYRFDKYRDTENKKKDMRIDYLINAWRKLEYAAARDKYDVIEHLEKPVADIQLFGTKKQIELTMKLANSIINKEQDNLSELLTELRNDLRKELNLEKIKEEIKVLRIPIKNEVDK